MNPEQMKIIIKEQIEAMTNMDIKTNPIYLTTVKLRNSMIDIGIPAGLANEIISKMKIDVNENFLSDEEFSNEIISAFAIMIDKIYKQSLEDDMPNYIVNIASVLDFEMKL